MNFLKSLLRGVRFILAQSFLQIAGICGLLVGGAAWSQFGTWWAALGGFVLVIVVSIPVYALIDGDSQGPSK